MRDPATYKPYINPAREAARAIRDSARYQANQEAGISSDAFRDLHGLNDLELCYFMRIGNFMPQELKGETQ